MIPPPSLPNGTPFSETTLYTQRSPTTSGALRRQSWFSDWDSYSSWSTIQLPILMGRVGLGVDFKDESFEPSRYRGADLEMDIDVVRSDGIEINHEIQKMEETEMEEIEIGGQQRLMRNCKWRKWKRSRKGGNEMVLGHRKLLGDRLVREEVGNRNEIQKKETELWNLTMKGNDLTAYTQRFQELILLCTRMVPNEEDRVERVMLQGVMRVRGGWKVTQGIIIEQQPPFKRQNISGQNVVRAYTTGNNERRGDFTAIIATNTQRALIGNQQGAVCYECRRPGNFRKDCPKLRNQNRGNQTRKKVGNKTGNQTGGNEAIAKAYAIGGGGM
ncbi:reverse transcriptase domain-containing protein [Tanacetum coccineum]